MRTMSNERPTMKRRRDWQTERELEAEVEVQGEVDAVVEEKVEDRGRGRGRGREPVIGVAKLRKQGRETILGQSSS